MRRRRVFIIFGIIFIIAACIFAAKIYPYIPKTNKVEQNVQSELKKAFDAGLVVEKKNKNTEPVSDSEPSDTPKKKDETYKKETYKSIIDFESLQKENPDVCAWLYIPNTDISYPILYSEENDTYYLRRAMNRQPDTAGCLFMEHTYNKSDFSDPVTVIYGHKMRVGSMFGRLQEYYTNDFANLKDIYVFTPDKMLKYEVFAAVPYDNSHLLYYHNFSDKKVFDSFFYDIINSRKLGITVDKNAAEGLNSETDKILVLSTCTYEYNVDRFLVMAKLTE